MQVAHNGRADERDAQDFANLGEAIDACTAAAAEPQVLVRLVLDGCEVPHDDWDAARARSCREVTQLEIESRTLRDLAQSSLGHAARYCDPVCAAIDETAAHLREGRSAEGFALYAQLLDALTVLIETLHAARGALGGEIPFLAGCADELQPWLEALYEAQQSDDRLLIADYLEYEVLPIVRGWSLQLRQSLEVPT